jgi:hypothetical protein
LSDDDVTLSGPLFDGTAARAARDGAAAIRRKLAAEGAKIAGMNLAGSIHDEHSGRAVRSVTTTSSSRVYQTGRYSLPVAAAENETVVTADLATYGPWLEGTGSRNETTRFKGYHSFRRAAQQLDREALSIAGKAFAPYVRRMS